MHTVTQVLSDISCLCFHSNDHHQNSNPCEAGPGLTMFILTLNLGLVLMKRHTHWHVYFM